MNLPTEVILYVVDILMSTFGSLTAMDVHRAVNAHFHSTYDWHEFSALLSYMAMTGVLIEDTGQRNANGMVMYKLIGTP